VPPEFVKRATRKVAEINAAWDRIKRERGCDRAARASAGSDHRA
jgi:hypothetical protein